MQPKKELKSSSLLADLAHDDVVPDDFGCDDENVGLAENDPAPELEELFRMLDIPVPEPRIGSPSRLPPPQDESAPLETPSPAPQPPKHVGLPRKGPASRPQPSDIHGAKEGRKGSAAPLVEPSFRSALLKGKVASAKRSMPPPSPEAIRPSNDFQSRPAAPEFYKARAALEALAKTGKAPEPGVDEKALRRRGRPKGSRNAPAASAKPKVKASADPNSAAIGLKFFLDGFAAAFAREVSEATRRDISFSLGKPRRIPAGEFLAGFAEPSDLVAAGMVEGRPLFLAVLEPEALSLTTSCLFGGDDRFEWPRGAAAAPTPLQGMILEQLGSRLIRSLKLAGSPLEGLPLELLGAGRASRDALGRSPDEKAVAVDLTLEFGGATANLRLRFPASLADGLEEWFAEASQVEIPPPPFRRAPSEAPPARGRDRLARVLAELPERAWASIFAKEHAQVAATLACLAPAGKVASALAGLDESRRNEIVLRIGTYGVAEAEAVDLLEAASEIWLAEFGRSDEALVGLGGPNSVASLASMLRPGIRRSLFAALGDYDSNLLSQVLSAQLPFEALRKLDARALQLILREVQPVELVYALKAASPSLSEKVFDCLDPAAAEMLRKEIKAAPKVDREDALASQIEILKVARRLDEEGLIRIFDQDELV